MPMLRSVVTPTHSLASTKPLNAQNKQPSRNKCILTKADSRSDEDRKPLESGEALRAEEASDFVKWGGTLPSGRRAVIGGLGGLAIGEPHVLFEITLQQHAWMATIWIAISFMTIYVWQAVTALYMSLILAATVGNLGGITSWLLSLDGGEIAARSRVDVLIPVNGYKRAYNIRSGYEFQLPANWLVDQRLYRRAIEQAEARRGLDPPSLRRQDAPERRVAEPQVAYGPPGSTGEENVSIIAAPIQSGFRLEGLGSPEEAGQRFLSSTIAPRGLGLEAQLLSATQRQDEQGTLYYTIEYTVKSSNFNRHNLSVYGTRGGLLYTLNVQCPQDKFEAEASLLRPIPNSFKIL